jgi:hypothetical protein
LDLRRFSIGVFLEREEWARPRQIAQRWEERVRWKDEETDFVTSNVV